MSGLYLKKNSKMLIKSRLDVPHGTSGDLFLPQNSVLDRQAALILLGNKPKHPDVKKVLQLARFLMNFCRYAENFTSPLDRNAGSARVRCNAPKRPLTRNEIADFDAGFLKCLHQQ